MVQPTNEISAEFARQAQGTFLEHLGLDVSEISGSRMAATWEVRPELHQPFGILHGGVHCAVFETLASVAGQAWFTERTPGGHVVGVNNSTDFLRATSEGTLSTVATPVHQGRSQQLWLIETHDDQGRLVARGQVRLQNLAPKD